MAAPMDNTDHQAVKSFAILSFLDGRTGFFTFPIGKTILCV